MSTHCEPPPTTAAAPAAALSRVRQSFSPAADVRPAITQPTGSILIKRQPGCMDRNPNVLGASAPTTLCCKCSRVTCFDFLFELRRRAACGTMFRLLKDNINYYRTWRAPVTDGATCRRLRIMFPSVNVWLTSRCCVFASQGCVFDTRSVFRRIDRRMVQWAVYPKSYYVFVESTRRDSSTLWGSQLPQHTSGDEFSGNGTGKFVLLTYQLIIRRVKTGARKRLDQ